MIYVVYYQNDKKPWKDKYKKWQMYIDSVYSEYILFASIEA